MTSFEAKASEAKKPLGKNTIIGNEIFDSKFTRFLVKSPFGDIECSTPSILLITVFHEVKRNCDYVMKLCKIVKGKNKVPFILRRLAKYSSPTDNCNQKDEKAFVRIQRFISRFSSSFCFHTCVPDSSREDWMNRFAEWLPKQIVMIIGSQEVLCHLIKLNSDHDAVTRIEFETEKCVVVIS